MRSPRPPSAPGIPTPDHVRADLFLGLTDGRYTGLDDAAIVAALLAEHTEPHHGDEAAADDRTPGQDPSDPDTDLVPRGRRTGHIEVRVRLSTLLDMDELPGEVAGWGPVHAGLARDLTRISAGGQWRFALTGPDGQLLHAGITRRRPRGWLRNRSAGIVELQVPIELLNGIAEKPDLLGDWVGVVADLRRQAEPGDHAERHTARPQRPLTDDPHRRLPQAALRRYIQVRDRHCGFPTCRAPAHATDTDHTVDHARGGTTCDINLGDFCRHDHRLKHEGGWQLSQPEPGHFVWVSRLGQRYRVRPPPVLEPLPDPLPRNAVEQPAWTAPDDGWQETTVWLEDSEPAAPPEPPPAPEPSEEEPPPF